MFQAVQVDNPDRYALATLTVSRLESRLGSGAAVQFTRDHYAAAVSEGAPLGSVILTLHTTPHARDRVINY